MLQSIRTFARSGAPVFAECGGFLYLQLAGVLHGTFANTGKLVRFGYITLTANEDTLLCKRGEQLRAHEFHYFDTSANGSAFTATKPSGKSWQCMVSARAVADMHAVGCHAHAASHEERALPNIVAGFPHLYLPANPRFATYFVQAARDFAARRKQRAAGCTGCGGCAKNGGACVKADAACAKAGGACSR